MPCRNSSPPARFCRQVRAPVLPGSHSSLFPRPGEKFLFPSWRSPGPSSRSRRGRGCNDETAPCCPCSAATRLNRWWSSAPARTPSARRQTFPSPAGCCPSTANPRPSPADRWSFGPTHTASRLRRAPGPTCRCPRQRPSRQTMQCAVHRQSVPLSSSSAIPPAPGRAYPRKSGQRQCRNGS